MFCGTFLKLSTLKNLLCPSKISSLYKFIGMFARLSTFFSFWGICGLLLGLGLGLGFGFRLDLRVRFCVMVRDRVRFFVGVSVQVMVRV